MAYTQANYASDPEYYPQHNPEQDFPKQGFTPLKMYQCGHCDYRSDRTNNVKRHSERKHPGMTVEVNKPATSCLHYSCDFNLAEHIKNVLAQEQYIWCLTSYAGGKNPDIQKRFKCSLCNFSSHRKFNVKVHIERKHTILHENEIKKNAKSDIPPAMDVIQSFLKAEPLTSADNLLNEIPSATEKKSEFSKGKNLKTNVRDELEKTADRLQQLTKPRRQHRASSTKSKRTRVKHIEKSIDEQIAEITQRLNDLGDIYQKGNGGYIF